MPLYTHRGRSPVVDPDAHVAPTAVLCGDVHVGPGTQVLFGAVLTAEDGHVSVGRDCVVMENALVRGRAAHPATIGSCVLVGPHAHVNGADVADGCFLGTGCSLFPGSRLGADCEVRINAVVQVNTVLAPATTVPIAWVAVGDPARLLAPDRHDEIWEIQRGLDFPGTVYGADRSTPAAQVHRGQARWYAAHRDDTLVEPPPD